MTPPPARCLWLLLGLVTVAAPASAQNGSLPTARIFEAIGVREGATICEIGAGDGALSLEAADRVGARGRVYTSELGDERLRALRKKVGGAKRPQVEVVAGAADATNFPDAACDGLFMRNVYHHFESPAAMNRAIAAALKPGGRVAVVDFTPPAEAPRPEDRDQDNMHGVTPPTVSRELGAAGLQVVGSETQVVGSETAADRWFMVVAVRPES